MYKINSTKEFWNNFKEIRGFSDAWNFFDLLSTPFQVAVVLGILGVLSVIYIFIVAVFSDND